MLRRRLFRNTILKAARNDGDIVIGGNDEANGIASPAGNVVRRFKQSIRRLGSLSGYILFIFTLSSQ